MTTPSSARAVARGEYCAPARLLAELARHMAAPDLDRHADRTRGRRWCATSRGNTYQELAALLGIREKTVAAYRERANYVRALQSWRPDRAAGLRR
jgi:DNA-binding NarL/FixJ family response regulator